MINDVHTIVKKIILRYPNILDSHNSLKNALRDCLYEANLEMHLLLIAYDEGVVNAIKKHEQLDNHQVQRLQDKLVKNCGITNSNASWAVCTWLSVFDKNDDITEDNKNSSTKQSVSNADGLSIKNTLKSINSNSNSNQKKNASVYTYRPPTPPSPIEPYRAKPQISSDIDNVLGNNKSSTKNIASVNYSKNDVSSTRNDIDDSILALQETLKADKESSFWAYLLLGQLFIKKGLPEEAIDAFLEYKKHNSNDKELWASLGIAYLMLAVKKQIKYYIPKSIGAFETAIKYGDKDVETWIGLGNAYTVLGKEDNQEQSYVSAIETLLHARELDEKSVYDSAIAHNLGRCYFETRQYREAIDELKKAIAANGMPTSLTDLDWATIGQNGQEIYDKAKRDDFAYLGYSYYYIGDYGRAIDLCRQATELDGSILRAWDIIILSYEKLHKYDEAINISYHEIVLAPTNSYVWRLHGYVCERAGFLHEGLTAYEEALSLLPNNSVFKDERNKLYNRLYDKNGRELIRKEDALSSRLLSSDEINRFNYVVSKFKTIKSKYDATDFVNSIDNFIRSQKGNVYIYAFASYVCGKYLHRKADEALYGRLGIELLREKHGIEYVKRVTSVLFRNREIVFEPFDDNQFNPIKFLCERFFELQTEANRVMKDGRLVADVALHYYDISDDYLKSTNMHNNKPK